MKDKTFGIKVGQLIKHKKYGTGLVAVVSEKVVGIEFAFPFNGRVNVVPEVAARWTGITAASIKKLKNANEGYVEYTTHKDRLRGAEFSINRNPEAFYWLLGFSAATNGKIQYWATPESENTTVEKVAQLTKESVSMVEDSLHITNSGHGEIRNLIIENPQYRGLDDLLVCNFIHRSGLELVNINKIGLVEEFLKHGMCISKISEVCVQPTAFIRENVPEIYRHHFDSGTMKLVLCQEQVQIAA